MRYTHDEIQKMLEPIFEYMKAEHPNNCKLVIEPYTASLIYEHQEQMWMSKEFHNKFGILSKDIQEMVKNADGRNYFNEAYRNAEKQAPNLKGIEFGCQNYWELDPNTKNAVIYLDSPYAGTKQYGYARQGKFDFDKYHQWCREISKNNYVFISEQTMPDDFEVIWEQDCKRTAGRDNNFKAVERLFRYKEGLK